MSRLPNSDSPGKLTDIDGRSAAGVRRLVVEYRPWETIPWFLGFQRRVCG